MDMDNLALRVGHIDYLNCVPFFHYLEECDFTGTIVKGVPAQLNAMLSRGELDTSPSSSFEYARNFGDYYLLPGHSISAMGPVESVLLFTPEPLEKMEGQKIFLTGESATSVNLLHVLLRAFYGWCSVDAEVPSGPVEELIDRGYPALLIGDRALAARMKYLTSSVRCYDLASLWYEHTGLPFVFALWIVRRDALPQKNDLLARFHHQLLLSRQKAFAQLGLLAQRQLERCPLMTPEQIAAYWRLISYDLQSPHLDGLKRFFAYCLEYGLLSSKPELHFVPGLPCCTG
ncbi:MAG: menaquinone biosynthesis protein [Desulfuromonadaceae bacterium]|nr:menaquinone biosynthesis protein [Desulfuromonadaceae bacterium]